MSYNILNRFYDNMFLKRSMKHMYTKSIVPAQQKNSSHVWIIVATSYFFDGSRAKKIFVSCGYIWIAWIAWMFLFIHMT